MVQFTDHEMGNVTLNTTGQQLLKSRSNIEVIALSASLAVIIALSLLGNFLLIFSFARNERLRASLANKLILSLAVADFTTASLPLSYQLATILDVHLISNGGLLCTIGGLAIYPFAFISVLTMVMLSVDRYVALGYPLLYKVRVTAKIKAFMVAYPWIHGALFFILCGSLLEIKFHQESLDCGLSWSERPMAFTLSVLFVHIGFPFFIIVILSSRTLWLVRTHNRQILNYDGQTVTLNSAVKNRRDAVESKLAKVSLVIVLVFLLCWTPYVVTRTLDFVGIKLSSITMSGAAWVVYASSFTNPLIYTSLRADLRRALCSIFITPTVRPIRITNYEHGTSNVATRASEPRTVPNI